MDTPAKPQLSQLSDTISAPRTDAIYNCHGYLTKVPVASIEPFIGTFTETGETVADLFAGSGMTGLAAIRMGRKARLSDISALGKHIATGYSTRVLAVEFKNTASQVVEKARSAIGDLYEARRAEDETVVEMIRTVWSFTYICPSCGFELVYFKHLSPKGAPPTVCPDCSAEFVRRRWRRGPDVPVETVVRNRQGRLAEQDICDFDHKMIEKARKDPRQKKIPSLEIDEAREMFSRSGLGKTGMVRTGDFFSPRNAVALLELWRAINQVGDKSIRSKLRFAFTAILPRASRRYQWNAQRPLNAQNQTYYIAPVYYEWNIFELFERKVEAALRSDNVLFGNSPLFCSPMQKDFEYVLASAEKLAHLPTASVDYVFTDPPFGSNIFYSDMNLFQEAWLGEITDHASEAVVHTTGKRKADAEVRYESLLRSAFTEAFRVLKPDRHMSVVFGNSNGRIWGLVQRAIRDAGFSATPVHVAILDKGQRSVKGLNSGSENVVTVDLVLTVQKPPKGERAAEVRQLRKGDTQQLIKEAISELARGEARNPSQVYARILRSAIRKHHVLDDLHLSDVLLALRNAGYVTDHKTGQLVSAG